MLGFVPTAGVSITVGGVVGAEGSVGTMMSSSKHGLLIVHHYRANTHWGGGTALRVNLKSVIMGPWECRQKWLGRCKFELVRTSWSVVPWAVCADGWPPLRLNRFDLSNSSCSSRVTAELRGCDRKRFSSAAFIKKKNKKKKGHPVTWAGGRGFTAKIVVMNGAQRCEMHNRTVCRWVEWELSSVQFLLLPFWSRGTQHATLKYLSPTQRCLYSVYS